MAVSHLARAIFSMISLSPSLPHTHVYFLFLSLFLKLVLNPDAHPREGKKLRTAVRARFKGEERKERFKNGALSNYVSPYLPGYRDFNGGAHSAKERERHIELNRGE